MLLIETYLDTSPGKGLGMFAKNDIISGTVYWIRNEKFDKLVTATDLLSMDKIAVAYLEQYGCLEKTGNWYLCSDNARFSNHSNDPNSKNEFDENGLVKYHIASKNIKAGVEIFCDYRELCQTCISGVNFTNEV